MVCELCLAPLGPNEVSPTCRFLFALRKILVLRTTLSNKAFTFLLVPPTPSFDYLSDAGVVVASAHVKFKVVWALFRLHVTVFKVHNLVQLLHEFYVNLAVKLRLFQLMMVQCKTMSFRNWNVKEFQQGDNGLILNFHFLLEQNHNYLVDVVNCLVNHRLLKVLKGLKWGWNNFGSWIVSFLAHSHAIKMPDMFRWSVHFSQLFLLLLFASNRVIDLHDSLTKSYLPILFSRRIRIWLFSLILLNWILHCNFENGLLVKVYLLTFYDGWKMSVIANFLHENVRYISK